jgi:hypothetical protein
MTVLDEEGLPAPAGVNALARRDSTLSVVFKHLAHGGLDEPVPAEAAGGMLAFLRA